MSTIQDFLNSPAGERATNFLWALLILLIGYIVARIISKLVQKLLTKVSIDDRLAESLSEPGKPQDFPVEDVVATAVFWLIMIFPIVGALERLGFDNITLPLTAFLNDLTTVYLPRIAAAGILIAIAWLVATVLRFLVQRGTAIVGLDSRLTKSGATEEETAISVSESLATAVFWFVFLFFIPGILNALGLTALSSPIQGIFDDILGYVPNVLGAAAFALIGWFAAKIVRNVVVNLLAALGVDRYSERIGLSDGRNISAIVGSILYIFMMLIVSIAALEQLNIDAITVPATDMLTSILDAIPNMLSAIAILVLAYLFARVVAKVVSELLTTVEFDTVPQRLGLKWGGKRTPSDWIGSLIIVAIMLFASTSAAEILGSVFLVTALGQFIVILWNVLLALVIIAAGLYFANMLYNIITTTGVANAHMLGQLGRVLTIAFSIAIALGQLNIGADIINLAFGILLAAVAFAFAIAVGLGSRETAGREVEGLITALRTPSVSDDSVSDDSVSDDSEDA